MNYLLFYVPIFCTNICTWIVWQVIACLACTAPKPGTEMKTPQQKSIFGGGASTAGTFCYFKPFSHPGKVE